MTSPANTVDGPGGRHYIHPAHPGRTYMSVTTAISKGVPKSLDNWFKRATAEYAVDHRQVWQDLERDVAVELIKTECDRIRDAAGDRGTATHALLEAAKLVDPANFAGFDDYRREAVSQSGEVFFAGSEGYVDAGLRFLWDWRPTITHVEVTTYSHRYGYAGTADLFAEVPRLGRGVLDWKTSKDVYAEVALQLAAYRFADVMHLEGADHPVPDVDFGAAIHLRPDGTYAVVPLDCGPGAHRTFLHALEVAKFTTTGWRDARLPELAEAPTERPWWASPQRRAWLVGRMEALRDQSPAAMPILAQSWPPDVPTFKAAQHHTDAQLDAIAEAVSFAEAAVGATFYERDPDAGPMLGGVPIAEREDCTAMARRLAALPVDLAQSAEASMHAAKMPKLSSGRFTVDALASLEQVVSPLEVEASQRAHALRVCLGEFADDVEVTSAVVLYATEGRHGEVAKLTDVELERARLLAGALSSSSLVCLWADDGTVTLSTPPEVEVRLLSAAGGAKAALLAAGREAARTLGLPSPRSTALVVGEPLIVAKLVEEMAA